MNEQIVILDFGSQYTQVIARRIRECNVYSVILRCDTPAREIARLKPRGIILSGGPSSVYAKNAPLPDRNIFALGVPVLGICYGVQLFAQFLGGKVEKGLKREYGKGTLRVTDNFCPLFANLPEMLQVWNSHGDKLTKLPRDFKPVAVTENS
jgi:GMP synthase (glutamine-hydrolysing)